VKKRYVAPLLVCVALAVPASAAAHSRAPAVALDYRLILDSATKSLPGVSVSILDGDRDLHIRVRGATVTIRGDLGESMLRITPSGTWVNRASVTAVAEKLTTSLSHGWKKIASGAGYTWHEHRLGPPPYNGSQLGVVARFAIPATVDGKPVTIGGRFIRYRRPLLWPWLLGAAALAAAVALAVRRRPRVRCEVATVLGAIAGLAALAGLVSFDAADAPNGRVAWVQIVLGVGLAAVVYGALVRVRGVRRAHLGGIIGVAAAAVTLGALPVFQHGVVISLLPGTISRALCVLAFAGGAAAAATSYVTEEAR
jgi:hypothetical protein